jgi:hypothetical protein
MYDTRLFRHSGVTWHRVSGYCVHVNTVWSVATKNTLYLLVLIGLQVTPSCTGPGGPAAEIFTP